MAADNRLRWLLAALVVLIVAVLVAQSGPTTPPPAPRPAAPAGRNRAATPEAEALADVKLEALSPSRGTPREGGRDPFRFDASRAMSQAPAAKPIPGVPDDQVGAPPPYVPSGPPPPPPITLKFIGLVQKADGTRIAVLSDGKGPISGTEGEEIEGRYKILKIGTESIEIAYIDGRGRQTIRLTGQ